MRKKIMLVLIILANMLLTACSTTITAEEIEGLKDVAYEVKNSESYKLPDGYTISYPDSTTTSKIAITIKPSIGNADKIIAIFDMTKDEPELINYTENIDYIVLLTIMIVILIGAIIVVIIAVCTS